ncbi:MAG: hypothetical protein M0015_17460 [Betaproteobacteria bacterium]|nr:hypothetical protein [Betaproteobacteria bacterium]
MKVRIESNEAGVTVRIDGVAGLEQALLEAVHRCRESAWACASGECMNIETMDARPAGGSVFLTLTARPGVRLSAAGIEQCLGYLLAQAVEP